MDGHHLRIFIFISLMEYPPLSHSLYTYPNCPWTELDLSEVNWSNRNNWLYVLCLCLCVCGLWSTSFSGENCALEYHPKLMQMTVMITFVCVCSLRNSIHLNSKWKHQAFSTSHYNWHFPGWGKTETCTTEIWATGTSLNAINRKGPRMIIIGF